jgi:hypothetical protein
MARIPAGVAAIVVKGMDEMLLPARQDELIDMFCTVVQGRTNGHAECYFKAFKKESFKFRNTFFNSKLSKENEPHRASRYSHMTSLLRHGGKYSLVHGRHRAPELLAPYIGALQPITHRRCIAPAQCCGTRSSTRAYART